MTRRQEVRTPILTKGSLCSGIGALDAATPGEARWVAETNEQAAMVLKREHPGATNLGDITVPGLDPEAVDLVTSGDPCQSMSAAGRQMASKDERFLWPDVIRIIERVRPRHVFLENVQNLVSVPLFPGADRGTVLALRLDDLWRAGYEVRWAVIGACAVGAPHHRHRWFLRARWFGIGAPAPVRLGERAICGAPRRGGRVFLPTPNARDGGKRGTPSPEHAARRAADPQRSLNLEDAVALLPTPMSADAKGPGKSREKPWANLPSYVHHMLPTPVVADARNTRNATANRGEGSTASLGWTLSDVGHDFSQAMLPTPRATDVGTPGRRSPEGWRPQLGQAVLETWGRFAEAVALWEYVTGIPAPEPTEAAPKGGRRLNPALAEWMMGYPPGYLTDVMGRSDALRCAGNGVITLQARAAWDMLGDSW